METGPLPILTATSLLCPVQYTQAISMAVIGDFISVLHTIVSLIFASAYRTKPVGRRYCCGTCISRPLNKTE